MRVWCGSIPAYDFEGSETIHEGYSAHACFPEQAVDNWSLGELESSDELWMMSMHLCVVQPHDWMWERSQL